MTQKIVPNIWCNGNAAQAGDFYAATLPKTSSKVAMHYPDNGPEFTNPLAGQPVVVEVEVDGYGITLINAGAEFAPNPTISFFLNFDPLLFGDEATARESLAGVWAGLAEGGTPLMELGEYPWSKQYGWIQDQFGVSWQVMLTEPSGEPRPFVIPQLMFGGPAVNRAKEAADYYVGLFDGGSIGMVAPYPEPSGPATAGSVMFGEFSIGGQWFSMMDAGTEQDFTFTAGLSLLVNCADQAEIDHLWENLSAVPEAEQCGWVVDKFGVSWQIVPANLDELLAKPDGFNKMMTMKKLVIADF